MLATEKLYDLSCGHCGCIFKGSYKQAWRQRSGKSGASYCSSACLEAALRIKFSKPLPNRGPCKTCGKEFFSRTSKIYCSLECYTKSSQFSQMLAENRKLSERPESRAAMISKLRKGSEVSCEECGNLFYQKPASKNRPAKRFCTKVCYRSFLAKRFDRWIANPQGMALPQCYDEFLDRDELECVVTGCTWRGKHLSVHMNQAHGVPADEFKRAAGFNLGTGVISRPLAEALQKRELQGVAADFTLHPDARPSGYSVIYKSLEGREHQKKARLLSVAGPQRLCRGCGTAFTQSTRFGRAVYCSIDCRDEAYRRQRHSATRPPLEAGEPTP